ncbi:MAG: hypothetical protein LUQ38_09315 [Methanotrichaceae archaeon]|nr:hypothetical protein [Methanotrichaceae archaeon]
MKKEWLEIGVSTGLVLLMILMLVLIGVSVPPELRSAGYALVMMFYIVAMGLVGIKLVDM